jgi:hypothetical protein
MAEEASNRQSIQGTQQDFAINTHLFSSRFNAKNRWKNGPLGPCKDHQDNNAL